jgi:histidinol-phosphate aminotransferase
VVIVDEAYAEYVTSPDYESVIPLVKNHPNLMVLRTFSKIYGLAGLRIGYAVGQPPLLAKLHARQARNTLNAAGLLAAVASLEDAKAVEESRRKNSAVRDHTTAELARLGFNSIPSHANFFMVDLGRDIAPVARSMRDGGVAVGRPFPPLSRHLRVTVGTEEQMEAFLELFRRVAG